jgi:hypothetical protein
VRSFHGKYPAQLAPSSRTFQNVLLPRYKISNAAHVSRQATEPLTYATQRTRRDAFNPAGWRNQRPRRSSWSNGTTARWLSCWTARAKAGLEETRRRLWRLYHRRRRSWRRRSSWWRSRRRTAWCRGARHGTTSWCGTRTPSRRGSSPAASSTPTSPPSSGSSTPTSAIECASHYCSLLLITVVELSRPKPNVSVVIVSFHC